MTYKSRGQIAYEGWSQGLPGCEWTNQTATQQRAWEASAAAVLAASPAPAPTLMDWSLLGPNLAELVSDFAAQARVGYGGIPVIRSKRVNVPAALFHRAVALRDSSSNAA